MQNQFLFKTRSLKRKKTTQKEPHHAVRRFTELARKEIKLGELGFHLVRLSSLTQKLLDCIVGEDVTMEYPWIYVSKEKIEDNLYLHSQSSDFLPIADSIPDYPEEFFLICLEKERQGNQKKDTFYMCTDIHVKQNVYRLLKGHDYRFNMAVALSTIKVPQEWFTWGSEKELNAEIQRNLRPLFRIEIDCEYPIFKGVTKFSLSLAYPGHMQFEECVSKFIPELVIRRQKHIAVQVSPIQYDNFTQCERVHQINKQTQHDHRSDYHFPLYKYKKLSIFVQEKHSLLADSMLQNAYLDSFTPDFEVQPTELENKEYIERQQTIKYFRDVDYCQNKLVSAAVWHPRISGIVAVAYTCKPPHVIIKEPIRFQQKQECLENVVLIWSYDCVMRPTLILHSNREVTSLCFCPYNIDILIGGAINGQILIWDLTGAIDKVEKRSKLLTPLELQYNIMIRNATTWLLRVNYVIHRSPTAVSKLNTSHYDTVTSISWLTANFECTNKGNFEHKEYSTKPFIGGQFVTCSLDGRIYIWDFHCGEVVPQKKRPKDKLEALADVSPYHQLNYKFFPIFKIHIRTSFSYLPLTKIILPDQYFKFETINPETEDNLYKRTYFKSITSDQPEEMNTKLQLVTGLGHMFTCTWTGLPKNEKCCKKFVHAKEIVFSSWIHDAPISECAINPSDSSFLLTIGGKVFAIWNYEYDYKPLLWRKSFVRYNSGYWSEKNAGVLVLFRSDSKVELWDLFHESKVPTRVIEHTVLPTLDVYVDFTLRHARKDAYLKTDITGTVKLTSLMAQGINGFEENNITLMEDFAKHIMSVREVNQKRIEKMKEESKQSVEIEQSHAFSFEPFAASCVMPVESETDIEPISKLTAEQLAFEYQLYELTSIRKNLKLDELREKRHLIMEEIEREEKIKSRLEQLLKSNDKYFDMKKKRIVKELPPVPRREMSLCSIERNELKQWYMESYYQIEEEKLAIIQRNKGRSPRRLSKDEMTAIRRKSKKLSIHEYTELITHVTFKFET